MLSDRLYPTASTTDKLDGAGGCIGVFYFTPNIVIVHSVDLHDLSDERAGDRSGYVVPLLPFSLGKNLLAAVWVANASTHHCAFDFSSVHLAIRLAATGEDFRSLRSG